MSLVRLSKARREYISINCSNTIKKGHPYYRVEPYPIEKIRRLEEVKHVCQSCAGGRLGTFGVTNELDGRLKKREPQTSHSNDLYQQMAISFDEPMRVVNTEVHVFNISEVLLAQLIKSPNEIYNLSPNLFEELICDRLYKMGFEIERVGSNAFSKDGGIDIVACNPNSSFPLLMAVQVKHHRSPKFTTGPNVIRDLLGILQYTGFNAGVVVTNTTFTPDAKWVAAQKPTFIRLRDIKDVERWLADQYLDEFCWRELPNEIEVCHGLTISVPKTYRA